MNKNLIYGLYCPFTNNLHYVGKSTSGLIRPNEHMSKSHSEKINEWVSQLKFLGYKPIVKILEECTTENLDEKEKEWINKAKNQKCYLLNIANNHANKIIKQNEYKTNNDAILIIGKIIKDTRQKLNYTQEDICSMANISRPTLIAIENGNEKTIYNNLKRVLNVLGFELTIKKIKQ